MPKLSVAQQTALWLGENPHTPAFTSAAQARKAWKENRVVLMHLLAHDGRRPVGWWAFEAPKKRLRYPGYDFERSYLYQHGILTEPEQRELLQYWKAEFSRAFAPHFFVSVGGGILRGVAAQECHFAWADIPRSLVKAWTVERRRATRRIQALAAEAQQPLAE